MLREFARDYPTSVGKSARVVAKELKLSRTAYNNFVKNLTETQDRVRRPIAERFLRVQQEKRAQWEAEQKRKEARRLRARRVAERAAEPYRTALEELRALPVEERLALWKRIVESARLHLGEDPRVLDQLEAVVARYLEDLPLT